MAQATRQQILPAPARTFEEFLEWAMKAEDGIHAEWVDGEIEFMSPVSRAHQDIGGFLYRLICEFVEAKQLGVVFTLEFLMRLRHRPSGREPDILFVANENLANVQENYLDGPADLVVEIVSPESQKRDRETKFKEYEQAGVREYWLIDPMIGEALFYQLQANGVYRQADISAEGIYSSRVLEGFWLDVNWLWQRPLPTMASMRQALGLA